MFVFFIFLNFYHRQSTITNKKHDKLHVINHFRNKIIPDYLQHIQGVTFKVNYTYVNHLICTFFSRIHILLTIIWT